ncbi:MAG: AAA family ATPase [Erythrobacter sp.]
MLFNLQKPAALRYRGRRGRHYSQPHVKLRKISSYVKLISPSVDTISAEKNPFDNTISVLVGIGSTDGAAIKFPLAQCSDGTVKWIALLTKVITSDQGFSIEEPENFLHPNVQKEFINLVRTESRHNDNLPYTLITTHSESLLNEADPSEVILVWMDDGRTIVKRVSNASQLSDEINRTGFGLGYYYTSGALEGA